MKMLNDADDCWTSKFNSTIFVSSGEAWIIFNLLLTKIFPWCDKRLVSVNTLAEVVICDTIPVIFSILAYPAAERYMHQCP